jgi:HD-GYP domain-containing protein (c-di-GMP phosphodiesterase class II)
MQVRVFEPPPMPSDDGFLRNVDSIVRGSIGADFTLWVRWHSQWLAWPGWEPIRDDLYLDGVKVVELLETAADRRTAVRVMPASDRLVLAIPFSEAEALVVAVAVLATDDLTQQLAASLQQGVALSAQLGESYMVAEDCARQISEELEQVTYLQSLNDYLQLCEVSRSPLDLARSVLPLLRDLIRAETLVFLTPQDISSDPRWPDRGIASPAIWIGSHDVDIEICRAVVRHFQSATKRQPVVRNRLTGETDGLSLPGLNSFLLVQVTQDDHQRGWILAMNRTSDPDRTYLNVDYPPWGLSDEEFGTVESGLVQAAASMLATHARNVYLFQEKECLLIGVLRSLINAMDAKDSYTCGHSDRVALVARRIGEELGLPTEECNALYVSGLLHDIGKIGVPDAVLLKPAKLTKEEYARIQQHPQQGYTILRHLDHLALVLPGVLHHHERYDGRGYPRGLQGEAIPLSARILAVADSYDAMSSCRPYRNTMPEAQVEAILREGAGTQWDPQVIAAFFRVLPEIRTICDSAEIHTKTILAASLRPNSQGGVQDSLVAALSITPGSVASSK